MTIAIELPDLEALRREQKLLREQLGRLRRRLMLESALEFLVDAALALTATAIVLVFLDWWLRFGTTARFLLLDIVVIGLLIWLGIRAYQRWQAARLDELSLAMALDRFRPGTGQRIADVLQLPDLLDENSASSSPAMVRLAVRQATEALRSSDWHRLWNRRRTAGRSGALLGCLLVPFAFAALAPDAARLSLERWLLGSSERWPQQTYLTVMGLNHRSRLIAPRDEPYVIEVRSDLPLVKPRDDGRWLVLGRGEPLILRRKPASPKEPDQVNVRERVEGQGRRDGVMTATAPGRYRFEFPPSNASSLFDLTGGDDWLGPIRIERLDRPELAEVKLRVREPGATYEGFREVEDTHQHLIFLPDTQVELTLVGNEPLSDLKLDVHPGSVSEPTRLDERTFQTRWTLTEAMTLEILLTSKTSGLTSKPAFLSLGLMRDREPRVSLRALGVGSRVTPVATIPLSVAATDDIGLAALRIQFDRTPPVKEGPEGQGQVPKTDRETIAIPLAVGEGRTVLDHQAQHSIELQTKPPEVGTTLKFTGEAEDRCARGTQTGRSSVLQLQVVSPDELFYDILIRQRAERAKFLAALEAVEAQGPALASAEPSREDYVTAMRVLHTSSRQIGQIAGRIADTLQEMKLNQIGSPKSHRLLQEGVIDPIRALDAGTMNELRGVLQALGGGAPRAGADAETARRMHGEVVTTMRNILEQMSQWESFVDVVNQVAEVIKMQEKVLKATEQARESRTKEVFDENP